MAFADVAFWTVQRFGADQSRKYKDQIKDRVRLLAAGHLTGRSCRDLIAPNLRADMRLIRAGRHAIIYIETARMIIILDVVHLSADLTARLTDPGPLD